MKKCISCLLVLLALLLPGLVMEADAATIVASGTCGENLTWTLDDAGTLTISGSGDMGYDWHVPWYSLRGSILSVVMEGGITSIDYLAFSECHNLTSVTIPSSVTSIGNGAFSYCPNLLSVTIPDSVTSIDTAAFKDSGLTSITIPNSVMSIGDWAFAYCGNLHSITIPNSMTSIAGSTFIFCTSLTGITLPESITSIGGYAFYGCNSLSSITIPGRVTSIGDNAFYDCTSLSSITIPESITHIGEHAFGNCYSFSKVEITDVAAWCRINFGNYESNPLYYANSGLYLNGAPITEAVIPEGITSIPHFAFFNCKELLGITIPETVTSIGDDAFNGCTSLTSISIPEGVTDISDGAFYGCSSLNSVSIPEGVTGIGSWAFYECISLSNIKIPDSVRYIGEGAFCECKALSSIIISGDVTDLYRATFYGCDSLNNIVIPNNVAYLGESVFAGCKNLRSITLPDSITCISFSAFSECTGLVSITIPAGVTAIVESTFRDCTNLRSITIPVGITDIRSCAFSGCVSLSEVHYRGTSAQRENISIGHINACITNAAWHYECTGNNCPEIPSENNPFTDVAWDAYYFAPVIWAIDNGITNGTSAATFSPDATCTRGQIVTFLWRFCGSPNPASNNNPFWDVAENDYYYKAVLWAVEKGITTGMGNGVFAPNDPCTRGQVVTFLWRSMGQPSTYDSIVFHDVPYGAYYYDATMWAINSYITNGMDGGTFAPDTICTRGQIVTFLYRLGNRSANLHWDYADDELINSGNYYHFVADTSKYMVQITAHTNAVLRNVSFSRVYYVEKGDRYGFEIAEEHFFIPVWLPDKPLVIDASFPGDMSAYGISFTDGFGDVYHYLILTSGLDGSLSVSEYEPL